MKLQAILVALSALAFAGTVSAQAASSKSFFLASSETGPSGSCVSTGFRLTAGVGSGAVPGRAVSKGFVLEGGFPATLDAPLTGRPWLTGVRPLYAPLRGGSALSLHGTELALGAGAAVKIGGKNAVVTTRTRDKIDTTMPTGLAPGWHPVTVTAGGSTTTLTRGLGVLPLLELEKPAEPHYPFTLRYRGSKGDIVVVFVGVAKLPFAVPVSPYLHGLELNPGAMLVLNPAFVSDQNGVLRTPLVALAWARPLLFQAITISQNPGYKPGSFTNIVTL